MAQTAGMRIFCGVVVAASLWAGEYSPLRQINMGNVRRLQVAWTYRTGEPLTALPGGGRAPAFETTAVHAHGLLYISSPFGKVVALEPDSGKVRWERQIAIDRNGNYGDFASRGVSVWKDRIFVATIDAQLVALDALTGVPSAGFVSPDLKKGLHRGPDYQGEYEQTSPPAVIGDLIITGSAIADNNRVDAPTGEVRAWDAKTGKLVWTWHPTEGKLGGANAWSLIRVDAKRGLVFVPTGSASPDYYGGERPGKNEWANSVVALEAKTGKLVWGFQTVHHDIWDYDVASPPELYTVKGKAAVAVGSKTGHVFMLDRATGKPLFPVEERLVPKSDVETASATQPFPSKPASLVPHVAEPLDAACAERMGQLRNEGVFTPPSVKGSLIVPGNIGGLHWGGLAWSPEENLLIAPVNHLPAIIRLIPRAEFAGAKGRRMEGVEMATQRGAAYGISRELFRAADGRPCVTPPWGSLVAVDTITGDIRWRAPLGPINLGGPLATGGGLLFIGAALDANFRAFDLKSGAEVWQGKLPASARSTPMSFEHKGKQYVVIAAGGHDPALGPLDNAVVAFALDGQ